MRVSHDETVEGFGEEFFKKREAQRRLVFRAGGLFLLFPQFLPAENEAGKFVDEKEQLHAVAHQKPRRHEVVVGFGGLAQRKDDLVTYLAHDLKTPLAVLYGYAMAFCDGRVPEEDEQRYHRIIAEKSLAASELIDTLAAYAKMDHPDYIPHLGRRHVGELLRDIAHEATSVAEQSGCSVEVKLPNTAAEELPPILVDEQLFRRALLNLVGNACQHNPAGTQVTIFCERVPAASPRDELVRISVADTGDGIAPEIADTLFDPFVTRNTARTSNAGTGLGLAITQKCISLMSGTIYVAKPPREGFATEFVIDLPVAP